MEECDIDFTPGALTEIAKMARKRETGARGLRSIVESVMFEVMYNLPDIDRGTHFTVTEEMVRGEESIAQGGSAAA